MTDIAVAPGRSARAGFLHALPAIGLISLYIWVAVAIFGWLFASSLLGGSMMAIALCTLLLSPIGGYGTWLVARMATEAEREA